jgi:hypothetical protein
MMELIIALVVTIGVAILAVVILRSKSQSRAAGICFTVCVLGWLVALSGITYAELYVSDQLIQNPHISYNDRVIFQLVSGIIGGLICTFGVLSSVVMWQYHGKHRLLVAAIAVGLLYFAVPIFWLFL